MADPIFETLDTATMQSLQTLVDPLTLDCVLVIDSDGQVTGYVPSGAENEQSMGKPEGYAQTVRGPMVYASSYKCKNGKVNFCYVDGNGNEKCTPVVPTRNCPPL